MQEETAQKQKYLYVQIIDEGYDAESFQEFIIAQNPEKGMDLEQWTMGELKRLVMKFKDNVDNVENRNENKEEIKLESKVSEFEEEESPTKKPNAASLNQTTDFNKIIKCIKTANPPIEENTKITIVGYDKKEGSLFEKAYVVYQIKTDTLESVVYRRYSDFESLREIFNLILPGLPIPPISRKGKIKRKEEKHLQKRMLLLEKFLNKMLTIPEIRSSEILRLFLTIKDFEQERSKYKKIKSIPYEQLNTLTGELELRADKTTNIFLAKTQKYLSSSQPEIKKLYKDLKGAASMLESGSDFLKNVKTSCRNLDKEYMLYRKDCDLSIQKSSMFSLLEDISERYGKFMEEQAKIFRRDFYALIKYESFYMINFLESLEKLSEMQQNFIDSKNTLSKKKEKLFEEGPSSKWNTTQKLTAKYSKEEAFEIMLPKETKETIKLREFYALYNNQVYQEINRSMELNHLTVAEELERIVQAESDIASQNLMIWADQMIKVKDLTIIVT